VSIRYCQCRIKTSELWDHDVATNNHSNCEGDPVKNEIFHSPEDDFNLNYIQKQRNNLHVQFGNILSILQSFQYDSMDVH
jgi:hypothetical protein